MQQEAPQSEFPRIEPMSSVDVLAHTQNGLAVTETWRQGVAARIDEAWEPRLARAHQREQAVIDRSAQIQELQALRMRGAQAEDSVVAANYQRQLDEKLVEYHRGRALVFGSRVTELTVERPRFAGIRTRFAEMRRTYHGSRARKAARRLIRVA
jgi:hypothetical protein